MSALLLYAHKGKIMAETASSIQRVTALLDVLRTLLDAFNRELELSGFEICRASRRSSGTVYAVIYHLEDIDWVTGRWEDEPSEDRPRRRYYQLTTVGALSVSQFITACEALGVKPKLSWL
jgi:hypothetical protein